MLHRRLFVSPTRELAIQTKEVLFNLSRFIPDVKFTLCIGGARRSKFLQANDNNHIIVGTPGRIADLLNKKLIKGDNVKIIVLDEAGRSPFIFI